MLKRFILEILRVFISLLWAIIGAIFWIPFLARMIAVFTVSVLLSVTKGSPMGGAERGLDAGVTFYIDGFRKISHSINNIIKGTPETQANTNLDTDSFKTIFIHLGYTFLFWISTLFIVAYLVPSSNTKKISEQNSTVAVQKNKK